MNHETVNMLYKDFLFCAKEVEVLLGVLSKKKPGTIRATQKNLLSVYHQMNQIRTALEALGYIPLPGGLRRLH